MALRPPERGLSLVEVLVAVAVFVTGAMSVARLVPLATESTTMARQLTYATVLAAQKLEELVVGPVPGGAAEQIDELGEPARSGGGGYDRRWTIEPVSGDASGSLVLISVEVTPRSGAPGAYLATVRNAAAP